MPETSRPREQENKTGSDDGMGRECDLMYDLSGLEDCGDGFVHSRKGLFLVVIHLLLLGHGLFWLHLFEGFGFRV